MITKYYLKETFTLLPVSFTHVAKRVRILDCVLQKKAVLQYHKIKVVSQQSYLLNVTNFDVQYTYTSSSLRVFLHRVELQFPPKIN